MFKFLKKNDSKDITKSNDELLSKTTSLLIHAAKIDENYTDNEKTIIKKTLTQLGAEVSKIDKIIAKAEADEENSNQILDFTREVKNSNEDFKIKVVETLWSIIYSNKEADMYESNLMRRLEGLLYMDNKVMGEIKEKVKKKFF